MPSLCNSTLCSCPDQDEFQYWSSFCEKPFISGDRMQIYKGKLNGKGPRAGDYSVVKVRSVVLFCVIFVFFLFFFLKISSFFQVAFSAPLIFFFVI
jgi:hypothetical protein